MTDGTKRVPRTPTEDMVRIARALSPQWLGWPDLIWRAMYDAAPTINEGGQAPCESTDGCTRAQVTWEQAISHAGTDHAMAAQPVPPSPDDTKRATVLPPLDDSESIDSWLIRHADFVPQKYWGPIRVLGDAIAALRAERDALRADRDRLAAECEHWRNVTARANPTDCAVGIKQLYDNWQQSQAECERLTRECQTLRNVAVTADERAEKAEVERDALRVDAERYRWLRDARRLYLGPVVGARSNGHKGARYILSAVSIGSAPHDTETLDAAIDAARKA